MDNRDLNAYYLSPDNSEELKKALKEYKKLWPPKQQPITMYYSYGEVTPQCGPIKDIIKAFLREANNSVVIPSRIYTKLLDFLDEEYKNPSN